MKTFIIIVLSMVVFSCTEDEPSKSWCITAVNRQTNEREFIRCAKRERFNLSELEADNAEYFDYQWEMCNNCE